MNFKVYSRRSIQNHPLPDEPHVVVSFRDTGSEQPVPNANEYTVAILFQEFDDVEGPIPSQPQILPISADQAEEIVVFIIENIDEISCIVTHCEAGISRSTGAKSALSLLCNGFEEIEGWPNNRVKRYILTAAMLRGWVPEEPE